MRRPFPFTAVVGHDDARLALLLAAIDPAIGGVLLRGAKGSAKSTLARGLAGLLPHGAPFVELPIGATEDRVLGSIDVRSLLGAGTNTEEEACPAFRPGLLAAADGGVLYVDEVNLLPDHLVDALLDAAASGVNRVERDGVSHEHPARFVLLGSMNPEEGELRPQLLDRFGLAVEIRSPDDPGLRAEAVRRRLAHDAGRPLPGATTTPSDEALARQLAASRPAHLPDPVLRFAAGLALAVGAESLRADIVLCRAAAALAGWEGRTEATDDDVARVAPLALGHRRRRRPFEPPTLPPDELDAALQETRERQDDPERPQAGTSSHTVDPTATHSGPKTGRDQEPPGADRTGPSGPHGDSGPRPEVDWRDLAGDALDAVPAPLELLDQPRASRRPPPDGRGQMVGDDAPAPGEDLRGVAVVGTVRAALQRKAHDPEGPRLQYTDLRQPRRSPRQGRTVVLAVDASGSMGTSQRVEAATGAVLGLLADAYLSRDRVALVAFAGDAATELLPPTASVELARARLADVPTGGPTPLAEGIAAALVTARRAADAGSTPLLVLLTDGRATGNPDALDRARQSARAVADAGIEALVLDAEDDHSGQRLGLAGELAQLMGARCIHLSLLAAAEVEAAVRVALGSDVSGKTR
jgi:magnesium chelatase subunit D